MFRVLPSTFKSVNNLICCKTGFMWVVKRGTSLFNSLCSNVARQVACFLLPFKRTLTVLAYKKKTFFSPAECWLVSSEATRFKNAINDIFGEKARKRRVDNR